MATDSKEDERPLSPKDSLAAFESVRELIGKGEFEEAATKIATIRGHTESIAKALLARAKEIKTAAENGNVAERKRLLDETSQNFGDVIRKALAKTFKITASKR